MSKQYDIAIIGGGINGCACAADAAMRGLSVILLEKGDIASQTSSSSTKLIHGGLRYLEHFELSLVKKALDERQRLLDLAPHLVYPQSFFIPHEKDMRPAWMIKLGLFLYDRLSSKNALSHSISVKRKENESLFIPLKQEVSRGYIFYDARTDDARLTLENALQARDFGAEIYNYTAVTKAQVKDRVWELEITDTAGKKRHIYARSIINTTGPWVNQTAELLGTAIHQSVNWVKGSHIIIPALYTGDHAYLLQNKDNRIVFVLPYYGYSMVGTTDVACDFPTENPQINQEEIDYLCDLVNRVFQKQTQASEIVYSWSGIRTLLGNDEENVSELSRDYQYFLTKKPALAMTVYGGKITTYRKLAEQVMDKLATALGNKNPSKTNKIPLPGAQLKNNISWIDYKKNMEKHYAWLEKDLLERYLNTYGVRTELLLNNCHSMDDLGESLGCSLYQIEVDFLKQEEWAHNMDDMIWRRTKLGLCFKDLVI